MTPDDVIILESLLRKYEPMAIVFECAKLLTAQYASKPTLNGHRHAASLRRVCFENNYGHVDWPSP